MITIQDVDVAAWDDGKILYRDLLVSYRCASCDLAVALGIPCGGNVIAVRHCQEGMWPDDDVPYILWARDAYDAGTIEMFQARFQNHFFQYAVPRKRPDVKRRPYFSVIGNGIERC